MKICKAKWASGIGIFLWFLFFFSFSSTAQFNHPELKWKVIETPHFLIHFHQGEENFAFKTASFAEEIYKKLTSIIGYHPTEKIKVVIENYNDETGGYTSIFTNKIVIQAQSDPLQTSGTLSWLEEVLAHELTHYICFAAIDESLFPLRKAIASMVIPMWFIEGLAQYLGEEWHTLKEMFVGDRARHKKIMREGELGAFYFFDGWGRLNGYYQSDSFVRYIFETYGKEKIGEIFRRLRGESILRVVAAIDTAGEGMFYPLPRFINFDRVLKEMIGKDSISLYQEWRESIIRRYKSIEEEKGVALEKPCVIWGKRAQSPVFSPDGKFVAFVSDKGYDFSIFDLYIKNLSTGKVEKLAEEVNPYFCFSPDGSFIVFSRTEFYPPTRSFLSDLYRVEIPSKQIKRLTFGERAFQPNFSPDGKNIAFVKKEGGNSNLFLFEISTGKKTALTSDRDGMCQNFLPRFSPDGEKIVFVRFCQGKRDIYLLNLKERKIYPLTQDKADDRCPIFSPDGKKIIFISDRTSPSGEKGGTFNLWSIDIERRKIKKHTQVKGGIFDPAVSKNGEKIAFSLYENGVFSIYCLSFKEILSRAQTEGKINEKPHIFHAKNKKEVIARISEEKKQAGIKSYSYTPKIVLHYIFPWFSIGVNESSFSLEFYASDVLEKHQLAGSAYFSGEKWFQIAYINRSFAPTLWVEIYSQETSTEFKEENFPVEISGGSLKVFYPFTLNLQFMAGYLHQRSKIVVFDSNLNPNPWEGTINAVEANIGYFNLKPVREPEMMPWGNRLVAGVEWADRQIGSELEYTSLSLSLKNYFRISKDLNFALQIKGKTLKNKDLQKRLVYTLDGWTELRGYPQDFLDSLSGENLVFASAESRINLKRQVGGSSSFYFDNIGLAFFYDAGATWPYNENLKKDDLHQDAGAELRMRFLPFGKYSALLRFGVSFPLDFDRKGRFFLMLGGVF